MRCYVAVLADAMPYPNPELGGYRSESRMVSHKLTEECRMRALEDYRRIQAELDSPARHSE